jgi:hypothetical protein
MATAVVMAMGKRVLMFRKTGLEAVNTGVKKARK